MKSFPCKIVMAVIILSCGFVMQIEQSEKVQQRQRNQQINNPEIAASLAAAQDRLHQGGRSSW
ncbi:hypothetical protein KOM00_02200 [Geomonas sp. Red69]|uniref:Secreted protein n=1 Tax=Geomonas diazotrophica TaxID=2843197 RepID=A0ABX8JIS6_9BACT|nr:MULTISPECIES: hypothetical protein [Geomonas]MBU5635538.1 hypothetical protein [Geomonas diazotrophica]QWV97412.1 hypothetical protein KP005_19045 [Geomonas nitrogeniifigens]QXE86570.1 hypothetical protein KP003_19785 [Geomonas nitrogeniifigens]